MDSKQLHISAFILVVVGAVNWGFWGLFKLDFVDTIFGSWSMIANLVYILIGLSGVYIFTTHKSDCKTCIKPGKSNKK